jgi:tripartite-type tricarboxylate transporter receptor subunit TctC
MQRHLYAHDSTNTFIGVAGYTRRKACALALLAMLAAAPAHAAEWPARAVTVVVPFAAGGFTDTLARVSSKYLSEKFGQPFVVENRPGAGGAIAAAYVAAAAPDGYTLFFGSASQLGISPIISKVSYDSDSFEPIAVFGTIPFLLGIKASIPAKTVPEFIAYAKANAGKLNYGTAGNGATSHLLAAGFTARAGIDLTHVPFKGSAPLTLALVQGTVDMAWTGVPDMGAQMTNENIRVIAISAGQRLPSLPDVPSVSESLPGFALDTWNGYLAPRGTPRAIVEKVAQGVMEAGKSPEIATRLIGVGITPKTTTPDEMAAIIKADKGFYPDLLKAAGMMQ